MDFIEIDNLEDSLWEENLASLPEGTELLQSTVWARIANSQGKKLHRFTLKNKARNLVLAQIIEIKKKGQKIWSLPRGPVFLGGDDIDVENISKLFFKHLLTKAKEAKVMFLRFEPENWPPHFSFPGSRANSLEPKQSLFLDLSLSEEDLLKAMHSKTRYNIRLAGKKGVEISQGRVDDIDSFWNLMEETSERDGFKEHEKQHYLDLIKTGAPAIELWLAKREGKVIAAGIFSFYGERATYIHGASSSTYRSYMAPHLLQWQMILRAKALGCRVYDFYGIDEEKWPGVTRFKLGFGGFRKEYPGTFVLPVSLGKYFLYLAYQTFRRLLK